ncbi:sensor histidine kinase KdpD [Mechercharimyces sp. CAU 1602]|uniref:sensor histidine kinase n=1 Tax=Mechercharimyces sp. CAU 1602 TaxID=2973933 RepID=UPI002162B7D0|nr:HAMP domain-containing sensor histidine kinase [Mechercharimyces sp. CAU 1602]MCS1350853.1 HAMP domain-containing histidine kinase [Mechercharimyces sp. CAU 1602]
MESFLQNPEIRRLTWKVLLIQTLCMLVLGGWMNHEADQLKQDWIKQQTALLGKVLLEYPELERDMVPLITDEVTTAEWKQGEQIAQRYGLEIGLALEKAPFFRELEIATVETITIGILSTFILLLFIYDEFLRGFKEMRLMTTRVEQAVEGKFPSMRKWRSMEEGELARLTYQLDHMMERMKHMVTALEQEKQFLQSFLSDISHQLKTPLASLTLMVELLQKPELKREQQANFLSKMDGQLQRMEWLIVTLLHTAKLEAGAIKLEQKQTDVVATLMESLSYVAVELEQKEIIVEIEKKEKEVLLIHDAYWLAEAFSNVLKNAIEHSSFAQRIVITITESPIVTEIAVGDEGRGIAKQDLPYLFRRFYKAQHARADSVGIGLSLAQAIVQRHQGEIRVDSQVGVGTTVTFVFYKHLSKLTKS